MPRGLFLRTSSDRPGALTRPRLPCQKSSASASGQWRGSPQTTSSSASRIFPMCRCRWKTAVSLTRKPTLSWSAVWTSAPRRPRDGGRSSPPTSLPGREANPGSLTCAKVLASRSASYFQTALACSAWGQPRNSRSNTACCQHCCRAPEQPSTGSDRCGISAQPTTSNGRSWTTCPRALLRGAGHEHLAPPVAARARAPTGRGGGVSGR